MAAYRHCLNVPQIDDVFNGPGGTCGCKINFSHDMCSANFEAICQSHRDIIDRTLEATDGR